MSRFNTATTGTQTTNLAGGAAFSEDPKTELISLLSTSFGDDKFYRTHTETFERLKHLLLINDKLFAAKALIYARKELGMRTITHVGAAELAKHVSGSDWAKRFFEAVIHRPDDMSEIVAYVKSKNEKVSKAMQKGFAAAFGKFDAYQLAKYRGEGKETKLVDLVNILHPKANDKNREALFKLMKGQLVSTGTWEAELSAAGPNEEAKGQAWDTLITTRKLGYLALLRNLRNIVQQSPGSIPTALDMLTDEKLIRKSLVLPFQYLTAFDEIAKIDLGSVGRTILGAIDKAATISLGNLPPFEGETLVVLDVSGSMTSAMVNGMKRTPAEVGSVFAAALCLGTNADLMVFSDYAGYVTYAPNTPVLTFAKQIPFNSGGTNFPSVFAKASRKYERVIILSDMQGYQSHNYGYGQKGFREAAQEYKRRFNCDPRIFSFDLAGYGQLMLPEKNVFCLAGFSDKTIQLIAQLDKDPKALVNAVEAVTF
jgi:60 kDa SS-A/Ro ribonucleoprotein